MHTGAQDFLEEQSKGLTELAEHLRTSQLAAARQAALKSAARIRSLNGRVRALARSGVELTSISQGTVQSLIELQADIVNDGLTDAAAQIERIAYTGSVRDLAREQAAVLKAARERIAGDLARAMTILRKAADDARKVGKREAAPKTARKHKAAKAKGAARMATKPAARKAKRVVRKAKVKAAARKTRGRTTRKAKGKSAARSQARSRTPSKRARRR